VKNKVRAEWGGSIKEGAKAIALYLTFTGKNLETGKWHYKRLYMGPIKIPLE